MTNCRPIHSMQNQQLCQEINTAANCIQIMNNIPPIEIPPKIKLNQPISIDIIPFSLNKKRKLNNKYPKDRGLRIKKKYFSDDDNYLYQLR